MKVVLKDEETAVFIEALTWEALGAPTPVSGLEESIDYNYWILSTLGDRCATTEWSTRLLNGIGIRVIRRRMHDGICWKQGIVLERRRTPGPYHLKDGCAGEL